MIGQNARFEGEGTVQGQLFDLGVYPGVVLSPDAQDRVIGEVYRLDPLSAGETLRELDEYEGMEYRREIVPVRLEDRSSVEAWAYVLNRRPE